MKVYSPPAEVGTFKYDWNVPFAIENKREEAWIQSIKTYADKHGKGKLRGQEVRFSVADGYACYIVFSPSILIHLPVGDGYRFPYVERLTAKDIEDLVVGTQRIEAFLARRAE